MTVNSEGFEVKSIKVPTKVIVDAEVKRIEKCIGLLDILELIKQDERVTDEEVYWLGHLHFGVYSVSFLPNPYGTQLTEKRKKEVLKIAEEYLS